MKIEEILVHVSGPCTRKHDEHHRKLARSYSNFKVRTKHILDDSAQCRNLSAIQKIAQDGNISRSNVDGHDAPQPSSTSQDGELIVPMTTTTEDTTPVGATIASITSYIVDTPAATQALESQLLTSSLDPWPESQPHIDNQQTVKLSSLESIGSHSQLVHDPSVNVLPYPGTISGPGSPVQAMSNAIPQYNSRSKDLLPGSDNQVKGHRIKTENPSDEIRAPDPPVSDEKKPLTFITLPLQGLADKPQLKGAFKPLRKLRDVSPDGRGYWYIDTSSWDKALSHACWCYLDRFIGSGRAGCSVSCRRTEDVPSASLLSSNLAASQADKYGKSIRVYCWGEIIEHIYLLIYVASMSKVTQCPSMWIDANEQVVFEMA